MALDDLRARLGLTQGSTRHVAEDFESLDAISDPHTREDETHRGLLGWFGDHPVVAVFLALFATALIALFGYWAYTLAPGVVTNPLLWQGLGALAILTLSVYYGIQLGLGRLAAMDWLVLLRKNDPGLYVGQHMPAEQGDFPLFVPVKGFTMFGQRAHPYSIGDISYDLARQHSRRNRDPDDPAIIRLDPQYSGVADTAFGTLVVQLSEGLALDVGNESTLRAKLPGMAEEGRLSDLRRANRELKDEVDALRDDLDSWKRRARNAEERADERQNKVIARFIHQHGFLMEKHNRRSSADHEEIEEVAPGLSEEEYAEIEAELEAMENGENA